MREFKPHWASLLKCPRCRDAFLHTYDIRCVYPPLLPINDRRAQKTLELADAEVIDAAFSKVLRVDGHTISITAFEQALVAAWPSSKQPKK